MVAPNCVQMWPCGRGWRPRAGERRAQSSSFGEARAAARFLEWASSSPRDGDQNDDHRLNVASIYVLDKDEALDFYVNKLGLEKGIDFTQGDYRWLTVRVPGDRTPRSCSSSPARPSTTRPPPSSSAS